MSSALPQPPSHVIDHAVEHDTVYWVSTTSPDIEGRASEMRLSVTTHPLANVDKQSITFQDTNNEWQWCVCVCVCVYVCVYLATLS